MSEKAPIHDLKCWPEPFAAICSEAKRHEFRRDDRGYEVGDLLLLREWDPATQTYCGDEAKVRVTYLSRGPDWGIPDGFVVMSIALVSIGRGGPKR